VIVDLHLDVNPNLNPTVDLVVRPCRTRSGHDRAANASSIELGAHVYVRVDVDVKVNVMTEGFA
jgi:hypothetical protein